MKITIAVCFGLLTSIVASAERPARATNLDEAIGQETISAILSSGKAEAQTAKALAHITPGADPKVGDVTNPSNRNAPKPLTTEQARQVRQILTDPRSYRWGSVNFCAPTYTLRISFLQAGSPITADLCFSCGHIRFAQEEKALGYADFGPASAELLVLFREIFPEDQPLKIMADLFERRRSLKNKP